MKRIIFIIISIAFLAVSLFVNISLTDSTQKYSQSRQKYADELNYKKRLLNIDEWYKQEKVIKNRKEKTDKLLEDAKKNIDRQNEYAGIFILLSVVYFVFVLILFMKQKTSLKYLTLSLITIAIAALYVGVFAPMLEIVAYEKNMEIPLKVAVDIPFVGEKHIGYTQKFSGEMYFFYQSKSIANLIDMLFFQAKNTVVGLAILIFSVVIPLLKLFASIFVLINIRLMKLSFFSFIINKIGKWSMADVFVAATFLAYLAFQNMSTDILTDSNSMIGIYYFLSYCVLSLISSTTTGIYVKRMTIPKNHCL